MEDKQSNFTVMWWSTEGEVLASVGAQYLSDALDRAREALGNRSTRDVTITRINRTEAS